MCSLSHLLLTVDASLNFLVYSCCTVAFRQRAVNMLQLLGSCTNTAPPHLERGTEMIRQGITRHARTIITCPWLLGYWVITSVHTKHKK